MLFVLVTGEDHPPDRVACEMEILKGDKNSDFADCKILEKLFPETKDGERGEGKNQYKYSLPFKRNILVKINQCRSICKI